MPANERDSKKQKATAYRGICRIPSPASFFEHIQFTDSSPEGELEGWISQLSKEATFPRVMEYVRRRNEVDSLFKKSHPLLFMFPHVWLPGDSETYKYLERVDGQGDRFTRNERSVIGRLVGISLVSDWDYSKLPGILNDFLVPCILRDLDNQILNGNGARPNMEGLLLRQGSEGKGRNLKEVCLRAIDEFCQQSGGLPSAIIMSARQKLNLIKNLSKETPSILLRIHESEGFCFSGIPIVLSRFMPDDSVAFANPSDFCLISKEEKSSLRKHSNNNKVTFVYSYYSNIVLKEESSFMKVSLPTRILR